MCDFKPGDEVVCVDDSLQWGVFMCPLKVGEIYTIKALVSGSTSDGRYYGLHVGILSAHPSGAWRPSRFRKVQRRDLSAWLKTSVGNTDKLDKRQKKGVRA